MLFGGGFVKDKEKMRIYAVYYFVLVAILMKNRNLCILTKLEKIWFYADLFERLRTRSRSRFNDFWSFIGNFIQMILWCLEWDRVREKWVNGWNLLGGFWNFLLKFMSIEFLELSVSGTHAVNIVKILQLYDVKYPHLYTILKWAKL